MEMYMSELEQQMFNDYVKESGLKEKTISEYRYAVNECCRTLGMEFLRIRKEDMDWYQGILEQGQLNEHLTYKTIAYKMSVLYMFSDFIMRHAKEYNIPGYVNPTVVLKKPAYNINVAPDSMPTMKELDLILEAAKKDPMVTAILVLVTKCALTTKQVTELKKDDFIIDSEQNFGILRPFKMSANKYLKVTDDVTSVLNDWMLMRKAAPGERHMFLNAKGGALSIRSLQNRIHDVVAEAAENGKHMNPVVEVKNYSLDDLRNLSVTLMIAGGAEPDDVMDYAGIRPQWARRYETAVEAFRNSPVDFVPINFTIRMNDN